MIILDNTQKLYIKVNPIVVIKKELNIGGIKLPYECKYDLSNIPKQHHNLILQIITKI